MDAAYDAKAIRAHSESLGHRPISDLRQSHRTVRTRIPVRKSSPVKRTVITSEYINRELTWAEQSRLRERSMVERVFSRLKETSFGILFGSSLYPPDQRVPPTELVSACAPLARSCVLCRSRPHQPHPQSFTKSKINLTQHHQQLTRKISTPTNTVPAIFITEMTQEHLTRPGNEAGLKEFPGNTQAVTSLRQQLTHADTDRLQTQSQLEHFHHYFSATDLPLYLWEFTSERN